MRTALLIALLPLAAEAQLTMDAVNGTTQTAVVSPSGCHVLTRDTSACAAARTAQGLSGFWLKFSCLVSLSKSTQGGAEVVMAAAGLSLLNVFVLGLVQRKRERAALRAIGRVEGVPGYGHLLRDLTAPSKQTQLA